MTAPLFALEDVWVERTGPGGRPQPVLRGASVSIPAAGVTCLVGPSGSGKSTLLRLLNRLEDPVRGRILFRGQDLRRLDPLALRRQVGLVFQHPVMLPGTVRDNIAAALGLAAPGAARPVCWLERVGLPADLLDRDARDLSGGERQRVALARALAAGPEVLLLDEITSALDTDAAARLEQLVLELGRPVVWASHDPLQVRRVASRVLRLEAGQLKEATLP